MIALSRATRWLLGLMLFVATAANAQLLSNLANADNGSYGGAPDSADNFHTGAVPLTITRVDVAWNTGGGGVNRVGIYTDNAGQPSTTLVGGFFTNPNPTTSGTTMSYTGSATLAANTTYWMVADITDGSGVSFTFNNAFVAAPSTGGATMPPGSAFGDNTVLGSWTADPAQLRFALFGPAAGIPTLQEWALVLLALAILAIATQRLRRRA